MYSFGEQVSLYFQMGGIMEKPRLLFRLFGKKNTSIYFPGRKFSEKSDDVVVIYDKEGKPTSLLDVSLLKKREPKG